jgi:two-component system nitrogen regulation sensor histidine kinase NtrY
MRRLLNGQGKFHATRRKEGLLIIILFLVISTLSFVGVRLLNRGHDFPISDSILVFSVINIDVVLLLLLLFLTVRNLVRLVFERRRGVMGAKIRTKLVIAFITLSLLPTTILFFVSVQFISSSIEFWFNLQIEQSLQGSLEAGQDYYNHLTEEIQAFGNNLSRVITHEGLMLAPRQDDLNKFIEEKRKEFNLTAVAVYSERLKGKAASQDHRVDLSTFSGPGEEVLQETIEKGSDGRHIEGSSHGELLSALVPVFSRTESKAVVGVLLLSRFIPSSFVNRLHAISQGLQEYRQLKMLKRPMKISHMITLAIVTILIVLSSGWFGFYLSQGITVPIKELAEGTNRIASGDYDFFIDLESKDEIGVLVNSFNRMTMDLRISKNQVEEANKEQRKSNFELEQRRIYMEIVLANVAAGVVSADANGRILTVNKSAERMLKVKAGTAVGKLYAEVVPSEVTKVIDEFMADEVRVRKGFSKGQITRFDGERIMSFQVSLNVLRDDVGNYLGLVAVFEDISEVEKSQRMAAWREVAIRIAHEVKNPLTPIQLSAQRLRKRYAEKLGHEDTGVFFECTDMIVKQVDELKRLVNEFSNFARMPAANPAPGDLNQVIAEAVSLYREAHKDVRIVFHGSNGIPIFNIDKGQMKRVMINLLDNAIAAIEGDGEIVIKLSHEPSLQMVTIEVADNGKGIPDDHKHRLFEPYFSTKKHGTGLGLAIVNTIITDHDGFIRVQDNRPRGTKFTIELPVRI